MRFLSVICLFNLFIHAQERPNVLFISIDDLNNWVNIMTPEMEVKTPHINALAKRGVLFDNAHCSAPGCNPSRTAVLTGIRPSTSGVYVNGQDWRKSDVLKGKTTLPKHFKNHGYKVIGGGKLYHSYSYSEKALAGFFEPEPWDEYFPSKSQQMPAEYRPENRPVNSTKNFYGGNFDWTELKIEDAQMADTKVVTWAEAQLSKEHDEPVFLSVGLYRPHVPWYTPEKYFKEYANQNNVMPKTHKNDFNDIPVLGKEQSRTHWHEWIVENRKWEQAVLSYKASVTFTDAMVGRILKSLDEGPLRENTIIILWSDHGYHLGHKEHWEKFTLWSQATQVPLIISAPGYLKNKVSSSPSSLVDLYPTLVELCSLKPVDHLEGTSLVPWLKNADFDSNRMVRITNDFGNHAIRSKHWHYIRYKDGSEELYHNGEDKHQFKNLANKLEYAQVIEAHRYAIPKEEARIFLNQGKKRKKNK